MKKIISFVLAALLLVSAVPTALATNDYSQGTQVTYDATADNDGDGQPDNAEAYTVTVPAKLAPGGSGTVTLEGAWAVDRYVTVTASKEIDMVNSINPADKKTLAVTFDSIGKRGSNTEAIKVTEQISVADIENALFGTWSGLIEYNVGIETRIVDLAGTTWKMNSVVNTSTVIVEEGDITTQPIADVSVNGETLEHIDFHNFTRIFGIALKYYFTEDINLYAPVCLSGENANMLGLVEGWYIYSCDTYYDYERGYASIEDVVLTAQKCDAPIIMYYDIEEEYLRNLDVIDWLYDNAAMQ